MTPEAVAVSTGELTLDQAPWRQFFSATGGVPALAVGPNDVQRNFTIAGGELRPRTYTIWHAASTHAGVLCSCRTCTIPCVIPCCHMSGSVLFAACMQFCLRQGCVVL